MPVAALKPTAAASSGTKGVKRSAPIGEEPTSKRARVESVTRVFAADNNQGQSVRNRKGARNKNSTMRDLLTQSRNAMIPRRPSGSTASKRSSARSASRIESISSKGLVSHSRRTPPNFSNRTAEMDIERGKMFSLIEPNPSAPRLGTSHAHNVGGSPDDVSMRFASRSAPPSGAEPPSQGPPRVPFSKPSFQNPHPPYLNHPPLHYDSHEAAFDANQPESTTHEIRSEAAVVVAEPTANTLRRYGASFNRNHSPWAGTSLESGVSDASRHVAKKVQQLHGEGSSMPSWLIETLSTLPSRHPLAIAQSATSATSNNDSGDTSDGSTLSSFHASTSSLEYARRKAAHSHKGLHQKNQPVAAVKASTTPERSRKDELTSFAFAPPPISPLQESQTATPRRGLYDHDFATSTPPWRAKVHGLVHSRQPNQLKFSENHASEYTNSSLFDTSIAPILLSGQANASNRPNTPYSYFTASPPDTAFTLGSNISAEMQSILPSHKGIEDPASKDQAQHATLFSTSSSSVDPFGATWAALQSSKSEIGFPIIRPFNQRRFFFTDSQLNKRKTQPASYSSKNAFSSVSTPHLLSDSLTTASHIPQDAWSPSFPEAKLPNHRHALPPPKSQLRNNFLGAENPLVTPAAIEAATAAAERNPACLDVSDALNAADASIHVRFRIPTRSSSLSFSGRGHPGLVDGSEETQLSPFKLSDCAGDEHALADKMCFFYDDHPSAEHMVLMDDKCRSQDNYHGGDASCFVQLTDEAVAENALATGSRQDGISANRKDFKSPSVLAGIGTEDELLRLLEADAGEEVEMGDIVQPTDGEWEASQEQQCAAQIDGDQNDDSRDSICSWGDNDV